MSEQRIESYKQGLSGALFKYGLYSQNSKVLTDVRGCGKIKASEMVITNGQNQRGKNG